MDSAMQAIASLLTELANVAEPLPSGVYNQTMTAIQDFRTQLESEVQ